MLVAADIAVLYVAIRFGSEGSLQDRTDIFVSDSVPSASTLGYISVLLCM